MAKCPECQQGKCSNCTGLALDGDDFVACACTHGQENGGPGTTPTPLTTHHMDLGGPHGKYEKGSN